MKLFEIVINSNYKWALIRNSYNEFMDNNEVKLFYSKTGLAVYYINMNMDADRIKKAGKSHCIHVVSRCKYFQLD